MSLPRTFEWNGTNLYLRVGKRAEYIGSLTQRFDGAWLVYLRGEARGGPFPLQATAVAYLERLGKEHELKRYPGRSVGAFR